MQCYAYELNEGERCNINGLLTTLAVVHCCCNTSLFSHEIVLLSQNIDFLFCLLIITYITFHLILICICPSCPFLTNASTKSMQYIDVQTFDHLIVCLLIQII